MLILPESWDESKTDFKGEVDGFNSLKQIIELSQTSLQRLKIEVLFE